jgi:dTMP kinase
MGEGVFLALEGPDGSGKSTQAARLREWLVGRRRQVVPVREPGGTAVGERVRQILLDPAVGEIDVRTEMLLFMACRAQLVDEVIRPALRRGEVVVSDRFLLSTLVYQGCVGGLPAGPLREVADLATGGLLPDVTVVLDIPAEVGLARSGEADRMEQKGPAYHRRVREGYLRLADQMQNVVVVDASGEVDEVFGRITGAVRHVL